MFSAIQAFAAPNTKTDVLSSRRIFLYHPVDGPAHGFRSRDILFVAKTGQSAQLLVWKINYCSHA